MKAILVRAFALSIVFVGLAASTVSFHSASKVTVARGGNSPLPTPVCAPNDPSHCGMD